MAKSDEIYHEDEILSNSEEMQNSNN